VLELLLFILREPSTRGFIVHGGLSHLRKAPHKAIYFDLLYHLGGRSGGVGCDGRVWYAQKPLNILMVFG